MRIVLLVSSTVSMSIVLQLSVIDYVIIDVKLGLPRCRLSEGLRLLAELERPFALKNFLKDFSCIIVP